MAKQRLILSLIVIAIFLLYLGWQEMQSKNPPSPSPSPTPTIASQSGTLGISSAPGALCHSNGVLPDHNCTPGVIDPRITQDNIYETICKSGYTKTVRPPVSYTNKLKQQQIAEYGFSDTNSRDYEEDHLISLELGGAPADPKNLWPEPDASPNPKDRIENLCHQKVCSGAIPLAKAQQEIATNWQIACQ